MRVEVGGGDVWDYAMRNLAARADRIDYWIRRGTVPCPVHTKVDPALQRFVGLAAIGQSLKDQYNVLASPCRRSSLDFSSN